GEATVTDAHLLLGHIPPYLLGGGMQLDVEAAKHAMAEHVAQPLGLEVEAAARGVIAISNNDMVGAIRVISIERGHDPRDFALVAFGGAGPLHGVALAELLGARTVIIPPHPGVLSALGLLVSQLRTDYARTCLQAPPDYNVAQIAATFGELEAEAEAWFERENVPPSARKLSRFASLRYRHQGFELRLPWAGEIVDGGSVDATLEAFHLLHEQLYTFAQRDTPVEIVTLHMVAEGHFDQIEPAEWPSGGSLSDAVMDHLPVSLAGGRQEVPVYDRMKLAAGTHFSGPGLVVQLDSTALIPEGHQVSCDRFGNMIVAIGDKD
ncbi:MAG: hydantoinase/oxoprolinase family protein, partial [Alphaproteobacteria bacterium]|nr:hydantoinase/oxoprolinase family protein [Alphaproteobacteria bacterium]